MNEAVARERELIKDAHGSNTALSELSVGITSGEETLPGKDDSLVKTRLFVPGILYHVIRETLPDTTAQSDEAPSTAEPKSGSKKEIQRYSYIVCKGDDPSSRFRRIVLSPSFISDHLCGGLQDAIAQALKGQLSKTNKDPLNK